MKVDRFQSLYSAALLGGLFLAGIGALGTWYFGQKSAQEKAQQWALKEQQLNDEITASKAVRDDKQPTVDFHDSGTAPQISYTNSSPLPATPAVSSPAQKPAPALITSESGHPSSTPSQPNTGWNLSDTQRQKIVDSLGKNAGKTITICSVQSDPKGAAFAGTLKHVFEEAGWHVDGVIQLPGAKPPVGLNLACGSFPSPASAIATWQAFTSAGFHVSQRLDSKLTGGEVELIVGVLQ